MDVLMIVLRLVHVLGGVFWVGGTFFVVSLVQPTVKATGEEGKKFMQYLGTQSNMSMYLGIAATLTLLSGLWMYGNSFGFGSGWFATGYRATLTVGSVLGIIAWAMGYLTQARNAMKMKSIGEEIASAGGPPKPEQLLEMQALAEKMEKSGQVLAVLMALTVVAMSAAQYVAF